MAHVCFWPLCVVLLLTVVQGNQRAHPLPVPEIVRVTPDGENWTWKMNIEWRENFISSNKPEKVAYDLEIFHTEQMRRVHYETVEVKPDLKGSYQWSWTSPLPLQCTSHSVRLRLQDQYNHTSDWTPLYTLKGQDTEESFMSRVFPEDPVIQIGGEGMIFCCILNPESVPWFTSSDFKIQISNRTFVTEPLRPKDISSPNGFEIFCNNSGATYFTGYAPDDHNLTCETRDFSSVECHWSRGNIGNAVMVKNVKYTINGRNCSFESCVLNESIDKGVMNWTLVAENALGIKKISDTADPKHRVRLRAPAQASAVLIHARNATLEWDWNGILKHKLFQLICQVEVNGHIIAETFSGTGFKSVVLANLQPFKRYTSRVRCGSREHFYKWGDWSDPIYFSTKEDLPEPLDVWVQVLNEHTYVLWKNLTKNQSHGIITGYELLLGRSIEKNKDPITKAPNENCHELSQAEKNQIISISAKNSAGVSPPSSIAIPNRSSESDDLTSIKHEEGFSVSWKPSPNSSCGYVVDWFPTAKPVQCALKWKTIPSGVTNATINSGLEDGVKYTFSVYACTSGGTQLLQRSNVYVKELPPSGSVRNLKAEQRGMFVELSWEDMLEVEKRGLIQGYIVSYEHNGHNTTEPRIIDPSCRLYRLNLHPGAYTFQVKAFTSAGEGPGSYRITLFMDVQLYPLISTILIALAAVACVIIITIICCSKREWLKSKLYPDIPKPMLFEAVCTKGFHQCHMIDKILLKECEILMGKNPEPCPQVVPLVQKEQEEVDIKPKDPPWPKYDNDVCESQIVSPITLNSSYIEVPGQGIRNPTYSVYLSLPVPANVVLGYIPQTQN